MPEMMQFHNTIQSRKAIEPFKEMVAYEALWQNEKASFKWLSELFAANPGSLPSDLAGPGAMTDLYTRLKTVISSRQLDYSYYVLINGTYDYPKELQEAKEPLEVLYYSGNLDYLASRRVAIVGTRKPSVEGKMRAEQLARRLVNDNFTIVSGLAMGIDTAAHSAAIETGGRTIAVIGTPLDTFYPKENKVLQQDIARKHLLVSQVPFIRYKEQSINGNRLFFPERNKTMSALSEATIIVEASDTSGTLVQARAALQQGRKLFILENCFQNKNITWPAHYEKQGAVRLKDYEQLKEILNQP